MIKSRYGFFLFGIGLTLILIDYYMLSKMNSDNPLFDEREISAKTLVQVPENRFFFTNKTYANSSGINDVARNHKESGRHAIDILSIGSIHNIQQAKVQAKTWGSHISRRIFWLATDYDDPDIPN